MGVRRPFRRRAAQRRLGWPYRGHPLALPTHISPPLSPTQVGASPIWVSAALLLRPPAHGVLTGRTRWAGRGTGAGAQRLHAGPGPIVRVSAAARDGVSCPDLTGSEPGRPESADSPDHDPQPLLAADSDSDAFGCHPGCRPGRLAGWSGRAGCDCRRAGPGSRLGPATLRGKRARRRCRQRIAAISDPEGMWKGSSSRSDRKVSSFPPPPVPAAAATARADGSAAVCP